MSYNEIINLDSKMQKMMSEVKYVNDEIFYFMNNKLPKLNPLDKMVVYRNLIKSIDILVSLYDIGLIKETSLRNHFNEVYNTSLGEAQVKKVLLEKFLNKQEFMKSINPNFKCVFPQSLKYYNILNK